MATSYKGNTDVRLAWESGRKTRGDIDTLTLIKKGKYADLEAIVPTKGTDLITGYTVDTAVLDPARGLMGTLTITLAEKDGSTSGTQPTGSVTSVVGTKMAQLEKPLLTHPNYTSEETSIAEKILLWKAEPDSILRAQYQYKTIDGVATLAGLDLQAAKKIMKGVESYLMFVPVVTRTTTWKARKSPSADIGKISVPPVSVPGSWVYLKTADECQQQSDKKYVQTEEWTGSLEWDTDLYT